MYNALRVKKRLGMLSKNEFIQFLQTEDTQCLINILFYGILEQYKRKKSLKQEQHISTLSNQMVEKIDKIILERAKTKNRNINKKIVNIISYNRKLDNLSKQIISKIASHLEFSDRTMFEKVSTNIFIGVRSATVSILDHAVFSKCVKWSKDNKDNYLYHWFRFKKIKCMSINNKVLSLMKECNYSFKWQKILPLTKITHLMFKNASFNNMNYIVKDCNIFEKLEYLNLDESIHYIMINELKPILPQLKGISYPGNQPSLFKELSKKKLISFHGTHHGLKLLFEYNHYQLQEICLLKCKYQVTLGNIFEKCHNLKRLSLDGNMFIRCELQSIFASLKYIHINAKDSHDLKHTILTLSNVIKNYNGKLRNKIEIKLSADISFIGMSKLDHKSFMKMSNSMITTPRIQIQNITSETIKICNTKRRMEYKVQISDALNFMYAIIDIPYHHPNNTPKLHCNDIIQIEKYFYKTKCRGITITEYKNIESYPHLVGKPVSMFCTENKPKHVAFKEFISTLSDKTSNFRLILQIKGVQELFNLIEIQNNDEFIVNGNNNNNICYITNKGFNSYKDTKSV